MSNLLIDLLNIKKRMKIWKDIFSGDPMASNEFTFMEVFHYTGLEVNCRLLLPKGGGEVA